MKKIATIILTSFTLVACLPDPYEMDVPQGNILTLEQISQLEIGMSQDDVRNLLGSPSVRDPFHKNRWDYINFSTLPNSANTRYHIVLTFDDNQKLITIDKKDVLHIED